MFCGSPLLLACAALVVAGGCLEHEQYGSGHLAISLAEQPFVVRRGHTLSLRVSILRDGLRGPVDLEAYGLPAGITVEPGRASADERSAYLHFRAADIPAGVRVPFTIEARSGGVLAATDDAIFVAGATGEVEGANDPFPATGLHLLPFVSSQGSLLFGSLVAGELVHRRPSGALNPEPGQGGVVDFSALLEGLRFAAMPRIWLARPGGKQLLMISVDDQATAQEIEGLLLVQLTPEGIDARFGVSPSRTFVALPGFLIGGAGNAGEDVIVWGQGGQGETLLLRFSAQGTLLGQRAIEGGLLSGPQLLMQSDGKIIGAGPQGIVRFFPDLTRDTAFGDGGHIATGNRVPYLAEVSDGFLAAGSVASALPGASVPTLWLFDRGGRPAPGFSLGGRQFDGVYSGHLVNAFESGDGIVAAVSSTSHAALVRCRRDGRVDDSVGDGANAGVAPLLRIAEHEQFLGLIPVNQVSAVAVVHDQIRDRFLSLRVWH